MQILSSRAVHDRLRELAAIEDKAERISGSDAVKASYRTKFEDLKRQITAEAFENAGLISPGDFDSAVEGGLSKDDLDERRTAAEDISELYRRLFTVQKIVRGGRSGTVLIARGDAAPANVRFSAFLESKLLESSGQLLQASPPARYRVSVSKPPRQEVSDGDDSELSSEFLFYLRERGQLELRSFEEWRLANGKDDSPETRQQYEHELSNAKLAHEAKRWKQRYCRTSDIPMPGIHRGHRLLKLPIRFEQQPGDGHIYKFAEFREDGVSDHYLGPSGPLAPPDVDYDELVRRYVQGLKKTIHYVYDLEQLDDTAIQQFADSKTHVYEQGTLERFIVAASIAVQQEAFIEQIAADPQSGVPGIGPPPETVGEWLRSDEAEALRAAVLGAWGVGDGTQPGPSPAEGLMSVQEFLRGATELCLPVTLANLSGSMEDPESLCKNKAQEVFGEFHGTPGIFYSGYVVGSTSPSDREEEAQTLAQHVRTEVDRLANAYDGVWRQALQNLGNAGIWTEREAAIKLSGYEMRAYIHSLASHALAASGLYSSIRVLAVTKLQDDLADQPISTDVVKAIEVSRTMDLGKVTGCELTNTDSWKDIVTSYKNALVAVLSFLGADITLQASAESPAATESKQLYNAWTDVFVEFLKANARGQSFIPDNLLVLRLAPRTGRYGEVPQRSPTDRFQPSSERPLSARHPTRLTESYELEPLPDRYLWPPRPTLYLREDYSFKVQHLGFGIGANLYSLALLPEETQTIVMKSVKDTKTMVSESTAENILEEAGSETESDFAQEMSRETESETSSQESGEVTAKASASWGFGSAEVSGSYSAASSSRSMAKNASNVSDRLSNKLSAKRKVTIDTQRTIDKTVELHEEVATERSIANPNKGHTVTYHWFQMTRKLATQLHLEDIHLVYTSGYYTPVRVFAKNALPSQGMDEQFQESLNSIATEMPEDVARLMPPDSGIVVVTDPYTEVVPLAAANGFLARVFKSDKATEVSSTVWQVAGGDPAAPEGLGVAAFAEDRPAEWEHFMPLFSDNPSESADGSDENHVTADKIFVKPIDGIGDSEEIFLPNLDLRYRRLPDLPPTRYQYPGSTLDMQAPALPRLLMSKDQVVNTNGVFCDVMVGNCTALEDYLQRHRDLDLLEQRLKVATSEINLEWELAKNDLVEVSGNVNEPITELIKKGDNAFSDQLAVEHARLNEEKSIYEEELNKQKLQLELCKLEECKDAAKYLGETIYFDFKKAAIKSEAKPALDAIANLLREDPTLELMVVGHTAMTGNFEHKMRLSKARAKAVVDALVDSYGVDKRRLEEHGVGPLVPADTNATESGRAKNRRVEFIEKVSPSNG